jgi:O-antigen ligase
MQPVTGVLTRSAPRTTEDSATVQRVALGAMVGAAFCFLAATVVSVWAAYDGAVALNRFFLLLSGVVAVMAAPLLGGRLTLRTTAAGVTTLANLLVMGVALGYGLQRFGVTLLAGLPAWLPTFSDNQAAQLLALGLPFTVASIWLGVSERRWFVGGFGMLALLSSVVALVLTASRGAWLGIAAAAVVASYLLVRTALQQRTARRTLGLWLLDGLALLMGIALVGFYLAVIASPALDTQLGVSAQGGSALSRISLWRDSLPLIQDYFFTGSGLGATAMIYATYAYLLHVPYLYHAHNLYVQIALEQGVPALLAWLGLMAATAVYAARALRVADNQGRTLLIAGFAALTVLLVHGLFEAELYFGPLAALVFLPPALLAWSAASVYRAAELDRDEDTSGLATGIGVIAGAGLPLLLAVLLPGTPARWEANLGAVLQTRAELGIYHWPEWSFQDQVRVQRPELLAPAEAQFLAAMELDPTQPTAHRRYGAILLARGELDRAQDHLAAAYAVAPYDRATRQLLGEVLALQGDVPGAVQTWQGLDVSQGQFMVREWWYQAFGQPEQVEKLSDAVQAFQRAE